MSTGVVRAPFNTGQVSIGSRTFDVEGGVVAGLVQSDPEFIELQRAFGLTVEAAKTLKPRPAPAPVDKPASKKEGD